MLGCGDGIGRLEIRRLEEQPAEGGLEEHHQREQHQEYAHADDVLHRVVGMKRNAVEGLAVGPESGLYLDAVGVIRAGLAQRHEVQHHE